MTSIARPSEVATITTLRWSLKSTLASIWIADNGHRGEHRDGRATEHRVRDAGRDRTALGISPMMIMIRPAVATTQRLLIAVSRTRPTFSAKQV